MSTSERKEEEGETVRGGDLDVLNSALIPELDGELPEIVGDSLDYIEDHLPQTRGTCISSCFIFFTVLLNCV